MLECSTLFSNSSSQKVDMDISAWLIDVSHLDRRFSTALCSALYHGLEWRLGCTRLKFSAANICVSCNKL